MTDDSVNHAIEEIQALQLLDRAKEEGLDGLVNAVASLLNQEFGHILKPGSNMAWKKAAAGIVLAFRDERTNEGIRVDQRRMGFFIPSEAVESITGEPAFPRETT